MFRFPFTNFHELNLDWILAKVKEFSELIPPMQTAVDDVQEALDDASEAITKSEEALENANEAIETANEAKDIAEEAAQGTIVDGSVTEAKLADGAVTNTKLATSAVSIDKLSAYLQTFITKCIIIAPTVSIPSSGASAEHEILGLTAEHVPVFFGFSSTPENTPPCDVRIITEANKYTVTNLNGTPTGTITPIFVKSYN